MGLAILLALGFVVFWALLVGMTVRALLYPPRRTFAWCISRGQPCDPHAATPPRPFEEGSVRDPRPPHAMLPYWVIEGEDADGPVVIFSHGWAESKQAVIPRLGALAPVCSAIVAWDLPGHGDAPPGPTRLGADEHEALIALAEMFAARPVVLHGFSLGAGVSIRAAAAGAPVAGVIAEAPYRLPVTPARGVMVYRGLPHRLSLRPALALAGMLTGAGPLWRGFDRRALASRLRCPLLVIHSRDDEVSPLADGREIAAAAPVARLVEVQSASHGSAWIDPASCPRCTDEVRRFIAAAREPQRCAEVKG